MQLQLACIVTALAATVASLPTTNDALSSELDTREACRFASFDGVTHRDEIRPRCKWYVCNQSGQWHEVRDCGLDSWCDTQPTVCKDRFGTPF